MVVLSARSQPYQLSNLRTQIINPKKTLQFDTLSIVPNTFFIRGYDTSYFQLDPVNATLSWKKEIAADSVAIFYRVFPYRFNAPVARYRFDSIVNNFIALPSYAPRQVPGALFDFGTMNYNGSFGRSLSFGNSQDVVVNSQFNLQLNGLIGDSIQVAAAITDNNIPIQPDGTTQQLNEFDRVWLQFKKKGWEVNLGDIDLRQDRLYFLNFYKRLQGASFSTTMPLGKNGVNTLLASGAIAKGKFTRNIFQGQEGNQGPYRLTGVNNEIFFIVLAGTERVFLDGQLLQRGEDQDYIINYNTAEIAFTPRRMITKDSRIQVEFEYAERSYLNSMLYVSDELQVNKKLRVNIAAYNNADSKNSPINQNLDQKQRAFLFGLGDSIQKAFYPTATPDTFSVSKILYAQKDTLLSTGGTETIYVYSTHPDSARFSLGFIEVGAGRGRYVPDFNGANGKVYKWTAPANGVLQGNFEPATYLVTPKKQQLLSAAAVYSVNDKTTLTSEVAFSNYDVNGFASTDKNNDQGFAAKLGFQRYNTVGRKQKALQLLTQVGYEVTAKNFRPLERLRAVEFYRDWGLSFQPAAATEQLPFVNIELSDSADNLLRYQSLAYLRSDGYNGYRQTVLQNQRIQTVKFNNALNYTRFTSALDKGYFLRPTFDVSKIFPAIKNYSLGINYSVEHNEVRSLLHDSLSASSFAFETFTTYLRSDQAKDNRWGLTYFTRADALPYLGQLEKVNRSQNFQLTTELLANQNRQLRLQATYRQLNVTNNAVTNLQNEETVLGRAEYAFNEWKGLVTGNVLYEVGAGQEQRRDFSYIEVPAGRGEYAWNDYNSDGIPQLNEFEIAIFQDQAKFIRIYTPTNQFVKANYTQFNYNVAIFPKALSTKMKNQKLASFVQRLNFQSSLQTGKKQLADGSLVFNPFKRNVNDTALITATNVFTNTFSFNRLSTTWGFDVSNAINTNKSLLTYGFESRRLKDWTFRSRWNPAKQFTVELLQRLGNQSLFTPKFDNRNYNIATSYTEPRFTFTKGTQFRLATSYQLSTKQNQAIFGGEKSNSNSFVTEGKYNSVNSTSFTGKLTYTNIQYSGAPNSTISYIMLDALLPGKNMLWNLDLTKRLGNNLELNFEYEGRKPASSRTVHIGRASLRAIL